MQHPDVTQQRAAIICRDGRRTTTTTTVGSAKNGTKETSYPDKNILLEKNQFLNWLSKIQLTKDQHLFAYLAEDDKLFRKRASLPLILFIQLNNTSSIYFG